MALARTFVDSTAMPVRAQRDGSHQSGGSGSKNRDVHFFLSCFPEIPLHSPSALARRTPALRAAFGRSFEGPAKSSFQRGKNCTRPFKTADLACSPPEFQSAISIRDLNLRSAIFNSVPGRSGPWGSAQKPANVFRRKKFRDRHCVSKHAEVPAGLPGIVAQRAQNLYELSGRRLQ